MKKLVIFDFDGTLVDLGVDFESIRDALQEYFREYGIDMRFKPLLDRLEEALAEIKASLPGRFAAVKRESSAIIERGECRNVGRLKVSRDTTTTLKKLRGAGMRLAIVSMNCRKCVEGVLKRSGIRELFDEVVTRDDKTANKPSPEAIEMLLNRFDMKSEDAVMVGDTWRDYETAKSAGIYFVLIGEDGTLINKVTARIKNISDLRDMLGV